MPANVYECMFLLDTNKVAGDVPAAAKQIESILTRHGAEVLASRTWDERRLAYPIGKHKKGLYYLTYFRAEGKVLEPIRRDVALTEMILRSMTLKVEPKLIETMLTLAKDEHALALQTMHDDEDITGSGGDSGGRRREGRDGGRRSEGGGKD